MISTQVSNITNTPHLTLPPLESSWISGHQHLTVHRNRIASPNETIHRAPLGRPLNLLASNSHSLYPSLFSSPYRIPPQPAHLTTPALQLRNNPTPRQMGNICSRSENETEPFSQPGRVLGSASNPPPNAAPRAPLPAKSKAGFKSPGRTLGDTAPEVPDAGRADARTNAAIAAQKRAESAASAQKGKLGSKLAAQKARTQAQTLSEVSREQTAARNMDESSEARRWN
ncbi:uncharacterized protein CDV56_108683 [Aspergillus thermomutatus]|uniref:Uncharacterized protein n=1 Tax=Aspergillus thermomutatus TaxID=41047 RepID=A0A397HF63_ASPTH|nr:uncharacterized protein CDV56_108683 [Aspergillus thermomutatus]RHZ60236.1 hypothetical protein CDV56_108683 [Aspergillus thermomutatus]